MERVIWTMWWQGEQTAPPVVQLCLASMRRHANGARVQVLDRENYTEYVTLPEHIFQRVETGQITLTHLSDLIRMRLLSQYGGLWMDSTIFVTEDIPPESFEMPIFTLRLRPDGYHLSRGRWCGFLIGGHSPLFGLASRMMEEYWQDHTELADYFLVDYCIERCYEQCADIRAAIDALPYYAGELKDLATRCGEDIQPDQIRGMFQKTNWKDERFSPREDNLLGRLLREYGVDWWENAGQSSQTAAAWYRDRRTRYFRSIFHRVAVYGPVLVFWELTQSVMERVSARGTRWAHVRKNQAVKRYLWKLSAFQIENE